MFTQGGDKRCLRVFSLFRVGSGLTRRPSPVATLGPEGLTDEGRARGT